MAAWIILSMCFSIDIRSAPLDLIPIILPSAKIFFIRHVEFPVVALNFVLKDLAGEKALADTAFPAFRNDAFAFLELEHARGVSVIERFVIIEPPVPGTPVNVERADSVDLYDRSVGDKAEHRGSFRDEGVAARFDLLRRRAVELVSDAEIDGSLHHRY